MLCFLWAGDAQSQSREPAESDTTRRSIWQKIAGKPAPNALYLGWTTWHLRYPMQGLMNNHFWGATYRGFHAGTFITSHDDRGVVAGVQRVMLGGTKGNFRTEFGYRAGLVYGYDRELLDIAERIPVLPTIAPLVDFSWKRLGVEAIYAGIVITVGGAVRF